MSYEMHNNFIQPTGDPLHNSNVSILPAPLRALVCILCWSVSRGHCHFLRAPGGCPLPTFTASVCIICRRVSFSSVHLCQCIGPIFADSGVNFLDVHCRWHLFLIDFLQSVPLSSSFFVLICPIQSRGSKAEEWGRSLVILYTRVRPACGKTLHHVSCVSHKHRTILS